MTGPSRESAAAQQGWVTALHEAGHAVAAVDLGIAFESIRLEGEPRSAGAVRGITYPDDRRLDAAAVEDFLVYLAAGAAATTALHPERVISGDSDDRRQAEYWAGRAFPKVPEYRARRAAAGTRARELVAARVAAIRAVASALLERGELSYDEVRSIARGGSDTQPGEPEPGR